MREIKFRAIPKNRYDKDVDSILDSIAFYTEGKGFDGTFVYGHLNGDYILGDTLDATEEYYSPSYWIKIDKDTIMQYTGLKDKNGIEIYEGDIVRWNNKIGYIGFLKQEMGYCIILKDTDFRLGHRNIGSGYDFNADIEVIGNIYENPELI